MAKPQLPDTIRVCGKDHSVTAVEGHALGVQQCGQIDHRALTITYDTTWAEAQQRDTVLHEVIHACDFAANLELSEAQVQTLAGLLYGVLADNPEFARWLIAEVK